MKKPKTFAEHLDEKLFVDEKETYLILSGEGSSQTEYQFVMECKTLDEANVEFKKFKESTYSGTYIYIYKATKIKEE